MIVDEVKALPIEQKLQVMEAIWDDLRERFDKLDIPQKQKDLLDNRRAKVQNGEARLFDWESVKDSIGRK